MIAKNYNERLLKTTMKDYQKVHWMIAENYKITKNYNERLLKTTMNDC